MKIKPECGCPHCAGLEYDADDALIAAANEPGIPVPNLPREELLAWFRAEYAAYLARTSTDDDG